MAQYVPVGSVVDMLVLEEVYRQVARNTTWDSYLQDEIVRAKVRMSLAEFEQARTFRKQMIEREDRRQWEIETFGVGDGYG